MTAATFLIILGAVALAAAIAFGFGAQGVARDIVEKAYERRDEARQMMQQQRDSGRDASVASADTGLAGETIVPTEGGTTFREEDRLSARPLRREE